MLMLKNQLLQNYENSAKILSNFQILFALNLALCHTVIIQPIKTEEKKSEEISTIPHLQGDSPDEITLLTAAWEMGIKFVVNYFFFVEKKKMIFI
jgi:hypothetical protein